MLSNSITNYLNIFHLHALLVLHASLFIHAPLLYSGLKSSFKADAGHGDGCFIALTLTPYGPIKKAHMWSRGSQPHMHIATYTHVNMPHTHYTVAVGIDG